MKISPNRGVELRSGICRIATAIAFAFLLCTVAAGPARADDHRGDNDRGDHGDQHHDDHDRGDRGPDVYVEPEPDYYYAPQPDYYTAPEPDYYYAPQRQYNPPPQGVNLFFGF
ncbi:MAG: hypothetical protein ABSC63_06705 [Candidatus Binataceae bacterium]|jgi:hypothetical protein